MPILSFTRTGEAPDPVALATAITPTIGAVFTIASMMDAAGVLTVRIEKPTPWQPAESTSVQASVTAAPLLTPAIAQQRDVDGMPIVWKALALALLDQINIIRAALPVPLPAITPAQALAAIRAKAGTL